MQTSLRSPWPTRPPGSYGPCWRTTGSSDPTTQPLPRPRSQAGRCQQLQIEKGSHHRLLKRACSDGMTGKTVVGTSRAGRGTQSACKRSRRRPAEPIRDSRLRLRNSPNVRVQSSPSRRHELRAWQTGASMYVQRTSSVRPTLSQPTLCPLQRRGSEVDLDGQLTEQGMPESAGRIGVDCSVCGSAPRARRHEVPVRRGDAQLARYHFVEGDEVALQRAAPLVVQLHRQHLGRPVAVSPILAGPSNFWWCCVLATAGGQNNEAPAG